MKIKFTTETETLFEKDFTKPSLSEEDEKQLEQFENREIVSLLIEFSDGVVNSEVSSFGDIRPDQIKQITAKLK